MLIKKQYSRLAVLIWGFFLLLLAGTIFFYICSCKSVSTHPKGLVEYKSPNIVGYENKPILIDYYFLNSMKRINNYAKENNLKLYVTSSFRKANQEINGAIVPPARMSNHLAGHAIDMNIEYKGKWYDSKLMYKRNFQNLPANVQRFFYDLRKDKELRWGGDFNRQDPVHIDDYLNKNPKAWQKRFNIVQNQKTQF